MSLVCLKIFLSLSKISQIIKSSNHYTKTLYSFYVPVKKKNERCVSKVEMSPLTAKLKCPHGNGEDTHGAEVVTEVASDEDGGGGEDHLEGGE